MGISDEIERAMKRGAEEGLLALAHEIAAMADRNAPKGDPAVDPDPKMHLHAEVEKSGLGYVIVYREPYAAKAHEDVRLKHPRGGGPKFLESAMKAAIPQMDRVIGTAVEANMRRGSTSHR